MYVNNTIDNLKKVLAESEELGRWESWYRNYYLKYKGMFDYMLENLYRSDMSIYKHFVETMDFNVWEDAIDRFERNDFESKINDKIKEVMNDLDYSQEFEVYLMAGFHHVNGTAGLKDAPFVYFGIETIYGVDEIKNLIPHELNHMIRNSTVTKHKSLNGIKFGELLVSEGLGTVYPLTLQGKWTYEDLAKSSLKSKEKYDRMNENSQSVISDVLCLIEDDLDDELFNNNFRIDNSTIEGSAGQGYYVGSQIISNLIENGLSIKELTYMKFEEIISKYNNL